MSNSAEIKCLVREFYSALCCTCLFPSSWYKKVICFDMSSTQSETCLIYLIRLTSLASLLLGSVDVVLELDADLPLIGQFSNEGMFEEVLCAGPLVVVLHQTALNEWMELFRPADMRKSLRGDCCRLLFLLFLSPCFDYQASGKNNRCGCAFPGSLFTRF